MRPRVPVIKTPDWERSAANAINLLLGDIPEGGTTAQALVKASTDDFDMEWATVASGAHVHAAADVTFAPAGSIVAADVQAAIVELDTEKAAASHSHVIGDVTGLQAAIDLKLDIASYTAADVLTKLLTVDGAGSGLDADLLDGQSSAAFAAAAHTHVIADTTGLQAALDAKLDDTQASAFGLTLIDDADAATARTTLGLGTAATQNTGTSGATVPLLSTGNTWSGQQVFSGGLNVTTATPIASLIDNDTAGVNAVGYFQGRDSANALRWRIGKVFAGGAIYIDNTDPNFIFSIGGATHFQIDTTNSRINLNSGYVVRINSLQVLSARKTGWAVASGTATRTTFDTATVTLPQLAERVKALIDDLHNTAGHGLIGT